MAQNFSMLWPSYEDHLLEMMQFLLNSNEYGDVTLVCEDKKLFTAHKVILCASSKMFKTLLSKNSEENLLIYFDGIQSHQMKSILHYIYLGQTELDEENFITFMKLAKSLELEVVDEFNQYLELLSNKKDSLKENIFQKIEDTEDSEFPVNFASHEINVDLESFIMNYVNSGQREKRRKRNKIIKERSDINCAQCGKQYLNSRNLKRHIEVSHDKVKYKCPHCEKEYGEESKVKRHVLTIHESVKYSCDQCDNKYTQQYHLREHILIKHEGVAYPCHLYKYNAPSTQNLRKHTESVHEGIRHPCLKCPKSFSTKGTLQKHEKDCH